MAAASILDAVGRDHLLVRGDLQLPPPMILILPEPLDVGNVLQVGLVPIEDALLLQVTSILLLGLLIDLLVGEEAHVVGGRTVVLARGSSGIHLILIGDLLRRQINVRTVEGGSVLHGVAGMAAFLALVVNCPGVILDVRVLDVKDIDFFVYLIVYLVSLGALLRRASL